jgi:cytochrome c-type biogenesis protein CcmH
MKVLYGRNGKSLMLRVIAFLFLCGFVPTLAAIDKDPNEFTNPVDEARYYELIEELRCVVCQNQSLADSNAELAQDLRSEVRSMVNEGLSKPEIKDFLVQRYGDFVLYKPPLKASTVLLWLGPALFLLIAMIVGGLVIRAQRRARRAPAPTLSAAERDKLQQVLEQKEL